VPIEKVKIITSIFLSTMRVLGEVNGLRFLYSAVFLVSISSIILNCDAGPAKAETCWAWQKCWNDPPPADSFGISVTNNCYKPINIALQTLNQYRKNFSNGNSEFGVEHKSTWNTEGWWTIPPGRTYRLVNGQSNRYFYYYAETVDGQTIWGSNDSVGYINNRRLNMRQVNAGSYMEDYVFGLTCSN
jgi:hypothetical protein